MLMTFLQHELSTRWRHLLSNKRAILNILSLICSKQSIKSSRIPCNRNFVLGQNICNRKKLKSTKIQQKKSQIISRSVILTICINLRINSLDSCSTKIAGSTRHNHPLSTTFICCFSCFLCCKRLCYEREKEVKDETKGTYVIACHHDAVVRVRNGRCFSLQESSVLSN